MSESANKFLEEIFSGNTGDKPIKVEANSGEWLGVPETVKSGENKTALEVPSEIADIPADEPNQENMGIMLPETHLEIKADEIQEKIDTLQAEILKNKFDWQNMVNELNDALPENSEIFTLDPREIPNMLADTKSDKEKEILNKMQESSSGRNIANLLDQIDDLYSEKDDLNKQIEEIKKAA